MFFHELGETLQPTDSCYSIDEYEEFRQLVPSATSEQIEQILGFRAGFQTALGFFVYWAEYMEVVRERVQGGRSLDDMVPMTASIMSAMMAAFVNNRLSLSARHYLEACPLPQLLLDYQIGSVPTNRQVIENLRENGRDLDADEAEERFRQWEEDNNA